MEIGVYVHIPFCVQRCTYCDFNTYTGLLSLEERYVAALMDEVRMRAERLPGTKARTLYFGGGTPSLLRPEHVSAVLQTVRQVFHLAATSEVTLEANPGTVTQAQLGQLRDLGVNRLSLGIQSVHGRELLLLGRLHTWEEARQAFMWARRAGFESISLDLMYGLPDQTLEDWLTTLDTCLALEPDHLSLYALTLAPGTPLAEALALHQVAEPDPDLAADMYEAASERLLGAGFWQYELSNWARSEVTAPTIWALPLDGQTETIGRHVSVHNLIYWRNEPWLGLGAGAHSWCQGRRWSNHPHPRSYINAMRSGKLRGFSSEVLSPDVVCSEIMMMGLRLAEGVTVERFERITGRTFQTLFREPLEQYHTLGLIHWDGARVRLTARGRLLANQVMAAFLLTEGED